jgi:hypothetical protein
MLGWLQSFASFVNAFLATPAGAIGVALLISLCWTQLTKGMVWWDWMGDTAHRWATRWGAFLSGFLATFILWQTHDARTVVYAVAVGLASPIAYTLVIRTARHFWPWTVEKFSARPSLPPEK